MAGYANMTECDIRKCAHLSAKMQIEPTTDFARIQKRWFRVHQMAGYAKMKKCIIRKVQHLPAKTRGQQKSSFGGHEKTEEKWGVMLEKTEKKTMFFKKTVQE